MFEDESSASGPFYGMALLAEYRWPLSGNGAFLSTEADVRSHRGSVDGKLDGVGISPERKQLGESWPDDWSFEKKRSYGLTLRIGGSPGALRSRDESIYLLAALHRVEARITVDFNGCLSPAPCTSDEFTCGTDPRSQNFLS